ncbi:uncharacterized protein [Nothobranchius furzeri]|uniref:uncharacterized protein n=1 Tax=Nothobranchius furzeri TaxID=105023 RepID=UPI00390465D6
MPKPRLDNLKCSVYGCTHPHECLHRPPASEEVRIAWLNFIFHGNVPSSVRKVLFVCSKHFKYECFTNLLQYREGLAQRLRLIEGSVPTEYGDDGHTSKELPTPRTQKPSFTSSGCQTKPQMRAVGTQLSLKTLGPHFRSIGTQTSMDFSEVVAGTSTTGSLHTTHFVTSTPVKRQHLSAIPEEHITPIKRPCLDETTDADDTLEGSSSMNIPSPQDKTYDPLASISALTDITEHTKDTSVPAYSVNTYIVYEKCLLELFEKCPVCQRATRVQTRRTGTFLTVEQRCLHCDYLRKWNSQPLHGGTPVGNLQLSVAVYSNGGSFFKLEKIFQAMKLQMFHHFTFRRHARLYIEPAIVHAWKSAQDGMMEELNQQPAILGGDMRADSPGHSAKYGSYTMMDLRSQRIVDLQLVQSNEVGGSYYMELEGLKRSLGVLNEHNISLDCVVTDRHPQVQKYLRQVAKITHYYDVWHIQKGLSKKMTKIAQNKDCAELSRWLRSLKNHIYWTAASSSTPQERVAKWTSILNHVQNIHSHDDPVFPRCLHPQRTSRDKSKWLKPATPAFCRLENLWTTKRILKDVEKLSPHLQTSAIEAFHSVILQFAPKHSHYPFLGMLCR